MKTTLANPASVTLPISTLDRLAMDEATARSIGEELAGEYCFAEPFPHIVIDNFLPLELAERVLSTFPGEKDDDKVFESGYAGHHKRQVYPVSCPGELRDFFNFFNSAPVLQFLEGLTATPALLPDPYFEGGGFHEIRTGGKLGVHADFRVNERLHLQRRLNLLIYLNKDWQEEWGGELELWDRDMKAKAKGVLPLFNRCVVFSTDATSFHGHPDPLACPSDTSRKSIALYYYTASQRIYEDVPTDSTMYRARPGDGNEVHTEARRLRIQNYLKDWVPPVAFRAVRRLKDAMR